MGVGNRALCAAESKTIWPSSEFVLILNLLTLTFITVMWESVNLIQEAVETWISTSVS